MRICFTEKRMDSENSERDDWPRDGHKTGLVHLKCVPMSRKDDGVVHRQISCQETVGKTWCICTVNSDRTKRQYENLVH
ncbi:unnamed protein product [Protopolystoma xenopodis]|uniref:Uncharacterized protein n=1 Tax=Protopolystoma xenopodis TaxID=117903 RepID=A0A448WZW1_9PLAT|nr:unnamed protein product [Protopolystoma xenopodis]